MMATPHDSSEKLVPNDVDTYAHYAEGIDPARYFDSQAHDVLVAARQRWPLLAAVLHGEDGLSVER
jgi:hypothetical protein